MTEREALKLALEALEFISDREDYTFAECSDAEAIVNAARAPIPSIKKALANHIPDATKMVAQPEQEPVAVLFEDGSIVKYEDLEFVPEKSGQRVQMLYTAPAQRTWVGLTEEEKQTAIWSDGGFGAGALWAEAKLKEKNT
jgi:hypothetical protein